MPRIFFALTAIVALVLAGCGGSSSSAGANGYSSNSAATATPAVDTLGPYTLTGNTSLVRDPSVMRQGSTYYVFDSDPPGTSSGFLSIRCSQDLQNWSVCGHVFSTLPSWITSFLPTVDGLWAPDISFFNGLYHVYYAVSTLNSQHSAIGVATSPTLDPTSPNYQWTDGGEVLSSEPGDSFNAIDPNIFVDTDGSVWLNYGSYWSGVRQQQIDPSTGLLLGSNPTIYPLGARPALWDHPFEGASMVHHGSYYYLFASINHCCLANYLNDDYEQIVGRSTSPHGPFVDQNGQPLLSTGGTVLLSGNASWNAPGGGTAYVDATTGESILVFHAANLAEGGAAHLWVKTIAWTNDWPVLN